MLPDNNLPTLLGIDKKIDTHIASALEGKLSLGETLAKLTPPFMVRCRFKHPVNYFGKTQDVHTFRCFFISTRNQLCYASRKDARRGLQFGMNLFSIIKVEFFLKEKDKEFKSFEQFRNKFDTRFIKEDQILKFWNGTSSQHGGKYNKNDFRKIGKRGKEVMSRFLIQFSSIDEKTEFYRKIPHKEEVWILHANYQSSSHTGRDISIKHQTNIPYIFYSSEYHNCMNGRYGLIANENEYLWLEDD